METKVFLTRHCQPDLSNHDDRSRGLSPKGLQDCQLVSQFLREREIDCIYSSPYQRALATIKPFAKEVNLPIHLEEDFREREISQHWIDDFDGFVRKQWLDFHFKLPQGESLKEVQARNVRRLTEVIKQEQGNTILIASHGTAIASIVHFIDQSFGLDDFLAIKTLMPFIAELVFTKEANCRSITLHNLFNHQKRLLFSL
ncbi:histidine phosphatase family protein [Streptococcus ferus]|uniref:histidine phosphatase family protein n=1 Tax=Streptococcus ferus TaxID=1345 RepID=UPI00359F69FF